MTKYASMIVYFLDRSASSRHSRSIQAATAFGTRAGSMLLAIGGGQRYGDRSLHGAVFPPLWASQGHRESVTIYSVWASQK